MRTSVELRCVVGCGAVLAVVAAARGVLAAPEYVRLSFVDDTHSSMTVTWNTTADEPSEVMFGTSPGSHTKTQSGTSLQANAGLGFVHEVELTNLEPSTIYYYVAGSTSGGFSAEAQFRTGPVESTDCGGFRFVFVGDNRPDPTFGGGENWVEIVGQASMHTPAFMLNGGDMVINGDRIDQWLTFLGDSEAVTRNVPMMPTIGNHDDGPGEGEGANYNQLFALPRSSGTGSSGTEDYYFFTYANAIFVSLSTDTYTGGASPLADQAAWLDEVLTRNPKKWKFVYFHKPIYTNKGLFSHAPNEEGQNAALVEIFDKHHVDVVFASHNHWYERFEPSACGKQGKPGSTSACPVGATNYADGSVYLVSGGAGAFVIPDFDCGSPTGRAACSGVHHYVVVDVANENLKLETWGAFPQPNTVFDSITIKKSGDGCQPTGSGGVGGAPGVGGGAGMGALPGAGGAAPGGGTGQGGSAGALAGGEAGIGGSTANPSKSESSGQEGGCGCQTAGGSSSGASWLLLGLLASVGFRRNGRRVC